LRTKGVVLPVTFLAFVAILCCAVHGLGENSASLAAQDLPKPATYHVALNGSDANPGTREKPFATLVRAQQAVRQPMVFQES
jgi:hypothetical protein